MGTACARHEWGRGVHHTAPTVEMDKSFDRSARPPPTPAPASTTTHFGFKTVPSADKEGLVGGVFSSVASSYDLMNDAMSLGVHRLWKDRFVGRLMGRGRRASEGGEAATRVMQLRCLDVAGGTGDIAKRILEASRTPARNCHVHVVDINAEMLAQGEKRFRALGAGYSDQSTFTVGNAEDLKDIPDASIDLYTIAFGIRNCTHIDKVLQQAHRVLKKGGVFSCLEFSKVTLSPLSALYRAYSFSVIPNIGHIVAGDRDSYQYLVESIERFPSQEEFARMIKDAGFFMADPGWENLTFGVAAIHSGVKI